MSTTQERSRTRLVRRSRSVLAGAFACALAASALPALAQGAADDLKIAVIDTDQVVLASAAGKRAMTELDALRQEKTTQGEALSQQLQDVQRRLSEGRLSLSEERLADLQKEAEDKAIELRRFQDDANRELTKKRQEVLQQLDSKVMPVINSYGAEQGYDLIFRKFDSGLIFASEAVDITDEIIRRVDGGAAAGQ